MSSLVRNVEACITGLRWIRGAPQKVCYVEKMVLNTSETLFFFWEERFRPVEIPLYHYSQCPSSST